MRDGVIVHPVRFAFMSADEMARASRKSDLYVHAARIEVEGLGAREALRHGVVPVLARGPLTATSQFALTEESVFEAGDPRSLARVVDAWIDRGGKARRAEAARYRGLGPSMTSVYVSVSWSVSMAGWSAGENFQVLSLTGERRSSKLRGNYPRR